MKSFAHHRYRAEILGRIRQVSLRSERKWGRMSPHQMICHLNDSFRAVMGERDVSAACGLLQRTFIRAIALHVPLRWPPGIATRPEIDQESGGTAPTDFAADVAALETLIGRFSAMVQEGGTLRPHPIFGPLTRREWLRWGYLHTDHHLRQFGA
jgi:hypothetical protein